LRQPQRDAMEVSGGGSVGTGAGGSGSDPVGTTAATTSDAHVERVLIAMRHSHRLDETCSNGGHWEDKASRPYDTPIFDFLLPAAQAAKMRPHEVQIMISSPFRHCLQTAGVVCRELGVQCIYVDYGLSELMNSCRTTEGTTCVTYLSREQMQQCVGPGLDVIVSPGGTAPPELTESISESVQRYETPFDRLRTQHVDRSILCVSHGHAVGALAQQMEPPQTAFDVHTCWYLAVSMARRRLVEASLVSLL
jgi:broad specificity phosphatase PhoE